MRKSFIEKVESHCCDDSGKLEFHRCDNSVGLAVAMTLPALVLAVAMHSFSLAVPAVAMARKNMDLAVFLVFCEP